MEVKGFEKAKKIQVLCDPDKVKVGLKDTIIVPAQEEGFNEVFIGENCWYAIRIGGGKLKDIKYKPLIEAKG